MEGKLPSQPLPQPPPPHLGDAFPFIEGYINLMSTITFGALQLRSKAYDPIPFNFGVHLSHNLTQSISW